MTTKYIVVLGLVVILACSFISYRTVLVPKWRVQVVNENGAPYPNKEVRQYCTHYTYNVDPCFGDESRQYTDENGFVEFPERSFSLSLAPRIIMACKSYFMLIAHGSVGPSVYLISSGHLDYKPESGLPPERWVIPSSK